MLPEGPHDEDNPLNKNTCFFCGQVEEVQICNWCRSVYFCSKHHHFHRNRSKCAPFIIVRQGNMKRLIASRDIRSGETILAEKPAIVAPAASSHPVCVACLGKIKDVDANRCKKCNLPVCGQRCQDSEIHKPGEDSCGSDLQDTLDFRGSL